MTTGAIPGNVSVHALSGLGRQARVESGRNCFVFKDKSFLSAFKMYTCIFKAVTKYSVLWEMAVDSTYYE